MPRYWVVRWLNPDYGQDGEVELFDGDGMSTSLKFGLQLKATDAEDLKDALGVRMELETIAYLKSLDVPVLIVRYHAPTKSTYVRWLHSFRYRADEPQRTTTLRMTNEDLWFEGAPERLAEDVADIRAWRTSDQPLPLPVRVATVDHPSLTAQAAVRQIRTEMPELEGILALSAVDQSQAVIATLGSDFVEVAVLDMTSFKWSHHAPLEMRGRILAATVWVLTAMVLDMSGKASLAGRVLDSFVPGTPLCAEFRVGIAIGGILGEAGNVGHALLIARRMADSRFASASSVRAVESGVRLARPWHQWSPAHKGLLAEHFEFLIQHSLLDEGHRAAVHYSYGNFLFHEGDYRGSFGQMRRAAECDASYRTHDYWLSETASALFELGRFSCAETLYRKAQSLVESELDVRARRGDVLFHLGRYAEAEALFNEYVGDVENPEPWWVLKAGLLSQMKADGRLVDQSRAPELAEELLAGAEALTDPGLIADAILAALDVDLLCHDAWHRLGAASASQGDLDQARFAFLMAIATGPGCIGSFVDAFMAHVGHTDYDFVTWVFTVMGGRHHGSQLFDALRSYLTADGSVLPPEVAAAIDHMEAEVESMVTDGEVVIRFRGEA